MALHVEPMGAYRTRIREQATDIPSADELALYEAYFDNQQLANRCPLPLNVWRLKVAQGR